MIDLAPGMMVTSSVRLVSPLGSGAMGCVWIADHLGLHTQVAVKFMARALVGNAESVERFSREAAAASHVRSPHVVQMLDYGLGPGGYPYIVMELLEGQDLASRLVSSKRLPVDEAATIVTQVAKALARAHARGVVHRDIKPANLFLCDIGGGETFVKLLDFGLAKSSTILRLTCSGAMLGSPSYMSPEQLIGAEVDARTDLWALGVVAYEILVGEKPFHGETLGAVFDAIRAGRHVPPSVANPSLPRAVDAWFARACAVDRDARFASAIEMAHALTESLRPPRSSWNPIARGADRLASTHSPSLEPFPLVSRHVHLDELEGRTSFTSIPDMDESLYLPRRTRWPAALAALLMVSIVGLAIASQLPTSILRPRSIERVQSVGALLRETRPEPKPVAPPPPPLAPSASASTIASASTTAKTPRPAPTPSKPIAPKAAASAAASTDIIETYEPPGPAGEENPYE